ncbi:MAG: DNA polymerase III subunit gamma/tau [Chloroflexales bacterium]
MASQSLYRKWRSQTFDELIGQEHVIQTLRNAIIEGHVAHAYLFTGPRGVGKTSMARLLAKAVNCIDPDPAARPCGHCRACTSIAEGRAVDVIEMDAASHTSVDDAREIIERVQFRPAEMRFKVYVIDETHMLSTAAFNALLKTLEEPPDHAIFILATTEVHKVPATILSRCQRFTFTRHSVAATSVHLRRVAASEGLNLDAGVPEAISRAATGSMRDALGVLEQLASFGQGSISLEQVHSLLGMTAAAEVNALIDALLNNSLNDAMRAVNGVADQGADIRQFTRDLVERLRALMLLQATSDPGLLDVGEDELRMLEEWSHRADLSILMIWIKLFSGLDFQLRTTPYGHLPLELAVVEALVGEQGAGGRGQEVGGRGSGVGGRGSGDGGRGSGVGGGKQEAGGGKSGVGGGKQEAGGGKLEAARSVRETPPPLAQVESTPETPAPVDPPTPETPPAPVVHVSTADHEAFIAANADFTLLERVESLWEDIKRDVRPRSPMLQALLKDVRPIDVEGNTIVLLASSAFHKTSLEKPQNNKIVEDVISKQLGGVFAIRCTSESKSETHDMRGQIREARKDELIRAAMNIFDAHIVDIEPDT